MIINEKYEPAIVRGIKSVGVGKKGSKPLDAALAREILQELQSGTVSAAAKGAFFAGLALKGPTAEEMLLDEFFPEPVLNHPAKLARALTKDSPVFVQDICSTLLSKQELDEATARRLGEFLMSDERGDEARGLVASALRVRYETPDEYAGLWQSLQATLEPPFRQPVPPGEPIIQTAEPFDGVDHSYMITPLIGRELQKLPYRVVHLVGRNSGPKFVFNLLDLAENLQAPFAESNQDLGTPKPELGWFIRQQDMSRPVDRWVDIRRQTIKRPFLATLEKFLNPCNARILITSAFHPPYGEKMMTIAERAGFPACLIIRNGMEGSIAFPLKRSVKMLCSARQLNGSYRRAELEFNSEEYLGHAVAMEEKLETPSLTENAGLIRRFLQNGTSGYELFDDRVKATCAGIRQALDWIERNLHLPEGVKE